MNFNTIQEKAKQHIAPDFNSFTRIQEQTILDIEQTAIENNMTFHELTQLYVDNIQKLVEIYDSRQEQPIH